MEDLLIAPIWICLEDLIGQPIVFAHEEGMDGGEPDLLVRAHVAGHKEVRAGIGASARPGVGLRAIVEWKQIPLAGLEAPVGSGSQPA